jgi:ABC-2 type transport system permease protein
VGIYPGWLRGVLTFLVPVAFAVTLPAQAVAKELTPAALAAAVGLAVAALLLARAILFAGLRRYAGASA